MEHDTFHSWIMLIGIILLGFSLMSIIVPITGKILVDDLYGIETPKVLIKLLIIGVVVSILSIILLLLNVYFSNGFIFRF